MITVALQGGLGNQLFQIAAGNSIAVSSGRDLRLPETPKTHHSSANYYDTILRSWRDRVRDSGDCETLHEPSYVFRQWSLPVGPVRLCGYFQNYRYIAPGFPDTLTLPNVSPLDGAFLHIRGGDYVNHSFHDVGLGAYYRRAIEMFPTGTKFYIFTNDIPYAKTMPWMSAIDCTIVDEPDEVKSLALMAQCRAGGICANSTFSWWGAYLNRGDRMLVLPSKWFNDPSIYTEGYFFPGSVRCPV
jgi:hypothetical protein